MPSVSRANLAEGHPTKEDLERFMRGERCEEEPRTIVRHLLTGCRQCRRVTRRLWRLGAQERSKPRRREAARSQLARGAQEMLPGFVKMLEGIRAALQEILVGLPPPQPPDDEDDEVSVTEELRAVIECVIRDSVNPAIADLRAAAYYPEEPPEEDGHVIDGRARKRK
jgi:hypothetical protein